MSCLMVTLRRGKNAKKPDNLLRYVMSIVSKIDTGRVPRVHILSFSIMNYVSIWSIDQKKRQQKKHEKKLKRRLLCEKAYSHTQRERETLFRKRKHHSHSHSHSYAHTHISIKSLIDFRFWRKRRKKGEQTKQRKDETKKADINRDTHTQHAVMCWKMQWQIWRWTIQRTIVVLWKGTLNALKNAGEYTKLVNSLTEALVHVYSVWCEWRVPISVSHFMCYHFKLDVSRFLLVRQSDRSLTLRRLATAMK